MTIEVKDGETLVLLGASGSGKTTVLKMINKLVEPTSGTIKIDDVDINEIDLVSLRRMFGYAFQGVGLFPHMTVAKNISIVLQLDNKSKEECAERAFELLVAVNLDPRKYMNRMPDELSGGERQRVGVARALATNPKYLLMDEPFGALDAINRDAMQNELSQLRDAFKKTIVFVTHDIFEAIRLGDRIAVMNHGVLEQLGSVDEILNSPKTDYVKSLFQATRDQVSSFSKQVVT